MTKIARQPWVNVTFSTNVLITDASGVTIKVGGNVPVVQSVLEIRGSGTNVLGFRVQRAIWRHNVTFEYNASLGNITNTSGDPLENISETVVSNILPQFTTFDYDAAALNGIDTDTKFDVSSPGVDTCRHDEA